MNVALYGAGKRRWSMTERPRAAIERTADSFRVGPSRMDWNGQALTIHIDERGAPVPRRLRGTVTLHPAALPDREILLDGRDHRWSPIAPIARVEVAFTDPALTWAGPAYFDTNAGAAPLEDAFAGWDWSRAPGATGTFVLYNGLLNSGEEFCAALHYRADGSVEDFAAPPRIDLPRTLWRLPRRTRVDPGQTARVRETLTDAPFYARSVIETTLQGERLAAMHESLDLRRFAAPWVQAMLPFKAPRTL